MKEKKGEEKFGEKENTIGGGGGRGGKKLKKGNPPNPGLNTDFNWETCALTAVAYGSF